MNTAAQLAQLNGVRQKWSALTLAGQFVLAAGTVFLAGAFVIGYWVTRQIEDGVVQNSAAATTLYVDSILTPIIQNVEQNRVLSRGATQALDETLSMGKLGKRIIFFKLWARDGLVTYSSEPGLAGQRFKPTDSLEKAWGGQLAAELDELDDSENKTERTLGQPLLEIYSPVREPWSGEVIAVAEFYEIATDLSKELIAVRLRSWLLVAFVTICMMGILSGIVLRGSNLIIAQRKAAERRVEDLSGLLKQNEVLRLRVQNASSRATIINERYLKRISADLHDGPAQLLALVLLKMGKLPKAKTSGLSNEMPFQEYIEEAMREIRNISHGLTLPQIETMGLSKLVSAAVNAHKRRTGTQVTLDLPVETVNLTQSEKTCIYRFIQEGLSNAFRHADGVGQSVGVNVHDNLLVVSIADKGVGFEVGSGAKDGIGLAGLRERIESLGGGFEIESSHQGTRLRMELKISNGETI